MVDGQYKLKSYSCNICIEKASSIVVVDVFCGVSLCVSSNLAWPICSMPCLFISLLKVVGPTKLFYAKFSMFIPFSLNAQIF